MEAVWMLYRTEFESEFESYLHPLPYFITKEIT